MAKYAVRKVIKGDDGKNRIQFVDPITNEPINNIEGYTLLPDENYKAKEVDNKKPYAVRRIRRKADGMNETIFINPETNTEVNPKDLDGYNILDTQEASYGDLNLRKKTEDKASKSEDKVIQEDKSGKSDRSGEYYEGVDQRFAGDLEPRTASNNFGYAREDKILNALANTPNPIAPTQMGARMINNARRINNMYAVAQGRKALGIEGDAKKKGPGQLGDVTINGKTYPVGYEAMEPVKKDSIISKGDVAEFIGGTVGGMLGGPLGGIAGKVAGRQALKDDPEKEKLGRTNLTMEEARRRQSIASDQAKPRAPVNQATASGRGLVAKAQAAVNLGPANQFVERRNLGTPIDDPDLPARQMANVEYDLAGKGRSQVPSSGIDFKVSDVVTDVLGSGYTVDVTSGQEPQGRSPVGTPYRHPLGYAADLKIKDPLGRTLSLDNPTDAQKIKDVAQGMAARYQGNFGMGQGYMGPNTMHIDTMPLGKMSPDPTAGPQWGAFGKTIAEDLNFARAEGVMPRQYYDVEAPTPQARPQQETMVAEAPNTLGDSFVNSMGKTAEQMASTRASPRPSAMGFANLSQTRPTFSDIDRLASAKTIAGEIDPRRTDLNTPEGVQEARGIMSTIENRVGKYGSVKDVLGAKDQYSTWNTDAAAATAEANYAKNPGLYDKIVKDYFDDPKSNLGYTSYHADYVTPDWSGKMANATQIGAHRFGSLPEYGGGFGTNFGRFGVAATQPKNTGPTQTGLGTEARANAKASFSTSANTSASVGDSTSRGMASDENANRSTSSTSRESRDRNSGFTDRSTSSTRSTNEDRSRGSYGSSGRSGYSSIGSSSGFSSGKTSSEGKGSYGSSGRSGYSSVGSDRSSGFGSKSTSDSSRPGGRVDRDEKGWK